MEDAHKKMLMAIIGPEEGESGDEKPVDEETEAGSNKGVEVAVKEFFSAGKDGDYAAAASALQHAIEMCSYGGESAEGKEPVIMS